MKFSFLGFFNKLLKKSPAEEKLSADGNEVNEEQSKESENNENADLIINKEKDSLKNKKLSPLFCKIIVTSIFCIVLLLGVIAGLLFSPADKIGGSYEQGPAVGQQEQKQEQVTERRHRALGHVSGDWGITADELISRINMTFDMIGIRGDRIRNLNIPQSRKEFRHSFSSSLSMLGEISETDNVRRVAVCFDPAFDIVDFPLAVSLIRALIAAIDPFLAREDISEMIDSLGIPFEEFPPRQAELRYKNFIFRVWSVAGSAFVFTASLD